MLRFYNHYIFMVLLLSFFYLLKSPISELEDVLSSSDAHIFNLKKRRHRNIHYSASNYTATQWENLNSVILHQLSLQKVQTALMSVNTGLGIQIAETHRNEISFYQPQIMDWIFRVCVCVWFLFVLFFNTKGKIEHVFF